MVSLKCCWNTFLKWRRNPKIWVVCTFLFFYLHDILSPIRAFCKELGYSVNPWLFPHLFSNGIVSLLLTLALVLFLCDAPFLDQQQVFVLLRTGRYKWAMGQILYVVFASFVYFFIIFLLSILLMLPYSQPGADWGKVIETLSRAGSSYTFGAISFSFSVVSSYTAVTATLLSFALMWGVGIFLGLFLFLANLWLGKPLGVGIATGFVLLPPMFHFDMVYRYLHLSPVSWGNLSLILSGYDARLTTTWACRGLILCDTVLAALILLTIHKYELTTREEDL